MKNFIYVFALVCACGQVFAERLKLDDVELDYVVSGSGPPLYLLHGGMESRESFVDQIPEFSRFFTVVALDSREQGRSSASDSQVSYERMSDDLIALADHLGHRKISIVGLSDGGITAITTAMRKPDLIDKLVLLGATFHYDSYPENVREFIASYEWDGNTDPDKYPGNFIKHYLLGRESLDGFGDTLNEMAIMWTTSPTYSQEDLGVITAETLVINGDHNDTVLEHAVALYRGIPNASLFVVPNATHYALQEKPKLLNEVILEYLISKGAPE